MQESEVKRVKGKTKNHEIPRDPSMKGAARGGDKEANAKTPENEEPPIIQRYSE